MLEECFDMYDIDGSGWIDEQDELNLIGEPSSGPQTDRGKLEGDASVRESDMLGARHGEEGMTAVCNQRLTVCKQRALLNLFLCSN